MATLWTTALASATSNATSTPKKNRLGALPQELRDRIFEYLLPDDIDIMLVSVPIQQKKHGTVVVSHAESGTCKDFTTLLVASRQCRRDVLNLFRLYTTLRFNFSGQSNLIHRVSHRFMAGPQLPTVLLPTVLLRHARHLAFIDGYTMQPQFLLGRRPMLGAFTRIRVIATLTLSHHGGVHFNTHVHELRSDYTIVSAAQSTGGEAIAERLDERMDEACHALRHVTKITPQMLERLQQVFIHKPMTLKWTDAQGGLGSKAWLSRKEGCGMFAMWYHGFQEPDHARRVALLKRLFRTDDDQILTQLSLT